MSADVERLIDTDDCAVHSLVSDLLGSGKDRSVDAMKTIRQMQRDIRALAAERDAAPFLICDGCGTAMTDAELAAERAKRPELRSCCPERKMRPITREDWNRVRDEWAADLVRLGRRHREVQAALTEANARADAEWNKAIEAAAEKCDVATMDHIGDIIRGIGDDIRALRRDAGEQP